MGKKRRKLMSPKYVMKASALRANLRRTGNTTEVTTEQERVTTPTPNALKAVTKEATTATTNTTKECSLPDTTATANEVTKKNLTNSDRETTTETTTKTTKTRKSRKTSKKTTTTVSV